MSREGEGSNLNLCAEIGEIDCTEGREFSQCWPLGARGAEGSNRRGKGQSGDIGGNGSIGRLKKRRD